MQAKFSIEETFVENIWRPFANAEKQCSALTATPSVWASNPTSKYIRQASWMVAEATNNPKRLNTTLIWSSRKLLIE